jgi:zinc transport system substrate-binding protein
MFTLTVTTTAMAKSEYIESPSYSIKVAKNSPRILASIKPLQLIAIAITGQDQGNNTEVLLPNNVSPHNYQLKLSDTKKIESADVIIWVGNGLEYFLNKIINRFKKKKCVISMLDIEGLNLLAYKDNIHHHNNQVHTSDCRHGVIDTHVWMSIDNVAILATTLAKELQILDKKNSNIYEDNLQYFLSKLIKCKKDSTSILADINTAEIFTFHDAYGYLEKQYNFSIIDYLSASALKEPGAKHLQQLKSKLLTARSPTILLEPQFDAKVFQNIKSFAKISYIDPLASDIPASSDGYILFMQSLVDSLKKCIPEKK